MGIAETAEHIKCFASHYPRDMISGSEWGFSRIASTWHQHSDCVEDGQFNAPAGDPIGVPN